LQQHPGRGARHAGHLLLLLLALLLALARLLLLLLPVVVGQLAIAVPAAYMHSMKEMHLAVHKHLQLQVQ
jgi:hypothetical protein